jgi:hypothetical protein
MWNQNGLLVLILLSRFITAQNLHDNNDKCECYAIKTGNDVQYLRNYRFYDFRFFSTATQQFFQAPPTVNTIDENAKPQSVLSSPAFTKDWVIQTWGKGANTEFPISMYNSAQNVFVMETNQSDLASPSEDANTFLTLRTQRQRGFQTAGELESLQRNLLYASVRFHARVRGDAGACAGMFLYRDKVTESDVEVLTKDGPNTYHYTNQPSLNKAGDDIPGASLQRDGLAPWTEWHTHRIDWMPGIVRSYLDDKLVAENRLNVPKKTMYIDVNMQVPHHLSPYSSAIYLTN